MLSVPASFDGLGPAREDSLNAFVRYMLRLQRVRDWSLSSSEGYNNSSQVRIICSARSQHWYY